MHPSLYYTAAATVLQNRAASHGLVHNSKSSYAEKRRAIEEMFFKHLTRIDEMKHQMAALQSEHADALHREEVLLMQLRSSEVSRDDAELREQQRANEAKVEIANVLQQLATVSHENIELRTYVQNLEQEVAKLKQANSNLEERFQAATTAHSRSAAKFPTLESRPPSSTRSEDIAVEADPFTVVVQETERDPPPPMRVSFNDSQQPTVSGQRATGTPPGGLSGGGDVESLSPITTVHDYPVRVAAPVSTPRTVAAPSSIPRVDSVTDSAASTIVLSSQSSMRAPPPPSRRPKGPPSTSPAVPRRASSMGLGSDRDSATPDARPSESLSVPASTAQEPTIQVPASPLPQQPLRKFNFSKVSKLEFVGTPVSQAYCTLIENRYAVHLCAKPEAASKVPPLSIEGKPFCAIPAHPIKMFGQHWYVYLLVDHGEALSPDITSGCVESLTQHLQNRINVQQYMKLSDILNHFLGLSVAVAQLHAAGLPHGNIETCNAFPPRLVVAGDGAATPSSSQPLIISGFSMTPPHRNPLFRAPEVGHSGGGEPTLAADLWALGVTFWDITNYGIVPLYDVVLDDAAASVVQNEAAPNAGEELYARVARNEVQLECPENCPPVVFSSIIGPLLQFDPQQRPCIDVVVSTIRRLMATQQ